MSEPSTRKRGLPTRVKMRHDQHFVEELTTRHGGEAVGTMLAITSIEPDPNQPRSSMGDLDELVGSVSSRGVLEPILVRPQPESRSEAAYRIISGERRYRAASEAGLVEIPAIVMEVDEDEALEIALIENLQRKDLTPFEEAEGYNALAEIHGYTQEQVASAVGKSRSLVTETLQLLKMARRVRQTAEALGIQSKTTLLGIVKAARSEEEQIELLEKVAHEGLGREGLRQKARTRKRAQGSRRAKAPVFTFKDPDKTFSLKLSFRRSVVEKDDLIDALEKILSELRENDG